MSVIFLNQGSEIMLPWRDEGRLDLLEMKCTKNQKYFEKLLCMHKTLMPEDMINEYFSKGSTDRIVSANSVQVWEYCYKESPIYWFLQTMASSAPARLYAVPLSSMIDEEVKLAGKRFTKELRAGISRMLEKSVNLARWNHNEDIGFGIDDMFPLVTSLNDFGIKEIKEIHKRNKRQDVIPLRVIPVFNLPFIYCQIQTPGALEAMHFTIQNISALYEREEKKIIDDKDNLSLIAYIRLMKIQMFHNMKRVENLFITTVDRLLTVEKVRTVEKGRRSCESQLRRSKKKIFEKDIEISKWKQKYKNAKKEIFFLKRKIEDMDQRSMKLGARIEEDRESENCHE